ncbi:peroxisome assembly protein 26 [Denticeps clupeoides]|uniref:Peroxisome assembly protein 26 n=1 Tax=Denticeps clupeoides TaxID=299321 RepID=A0AAY4B886_9TELE|nr:peroxisome assembly protein 26 [Denticeps clupeoides]
MGSFRGSSPPGHCGPASVLGWLDAAVDHLMVDKEFHMALDACERGLEQLGGPGEQEEARCGELRASLCIVGIQAQAELNQWQGVLSWVLQRYSTVEKIPSKLLQMCILLYSKVKEHHTVLEATRIWLHCPSNMNLPGFRAVAELYLLHVLVPLGRTEEAEQFVVGTIGSGTFTDDQRHVALEILDVQKRHGQQRPESPRSRTDGHSVVATATAAAPQSSLSVRLQAVIRLMSRGLSAVGSSARSLLRRRVLLSLILLYLLFVRIDPSQPSSFPWVLRLLTLFRQTWDMMFGPFYRAAAHR